jgi:RecJ-like exonuclease
MSDYWIESVAETLEGVGIFATDKQIKEIAESMEMSCENCSLNSGDHSGESPAQLELRELKRKNEEHDSWLKSTEYCTNCKGSGYPNSETSLCCSKCNGTGRVHRFSRFK